MVVRLLVVTATVFCPYRLEGLGDGLGFGREESGEAQIAEEVKKTRVLLGQGHWISSKASVKRCMAS